MTKVLSGAYAGFAIVEIARMIAPVSQPHWSVAVFWFGLSLGCWFYSEWSR